MSSSAKIEVSRWSVTVNEETVEFRATPNGPALASERLGTLLGYSRGRTVRSRMKTLVVSEMPATEYTYEEPEYYLTRAGAARVMEGMKVTSSTRLSRVHALFTVLEASLSAEPLPLVTVPQVPSVSPETTNTTIPERAAETPFTRREQAAWDKNQLEKAGYVKGLITARRIAKELSPREHCRLAHKAAEIALGETILLDEVLVPTSDLITPVIAPATKTILGDVIHSARLGSKSSEVVTPVRGRPDPFDFEAVTVTAVPVKAPNLPPLTLLQAVDPRAWILSRKNLPDWASASVLAVFMGYGCTKELIGKRATKLGLRESHPGVTTENVEGKFSERPNCTQYFWDRKASMAILEDIVCCPPSKMKARMCANGFTFPASKTATAKPALA